MADNTRSESTARVQPTAPAAASTSVAPATLEAAIAALAQSQAKIAELMERQAEYNAEALRIAPRRRRTLVEYLKEKPRKRLLHEVFQNGRLVNPAGLSVETIKKLDTIAAGSYADGMLRVMRIKDGVDGVATRIHIFYSNKTLEQRMQFYMRFPTFTEIVNTIVNEMAGRAKWNEEKQEYENPAFAPVHDKVAEPLEEEVTEVVPRAKNW